jgi:phosphopantothenoylcysteine synthetase/decarboxylase
MKKIILGISSSIAAYRACDLARLFVKADYSVFPVLTENAQRLVSPYTLETLCGNPAYTDTFVKNNRSMGHIELKEGASLLLVAPATANIIGKFANGIADDLLSTTFLSVDCPVLIAPAMNPNMWAHPAVLENVRRLKSWNVRFVDPMDGAVACGDIGTGKLADIETIYRAALDVIGK